MKSRKSTQIIQLGIADGFRPRVPVQLEKAPAGLEFRNTLLATPFLPLSIVSQLLERFRTRNVKFPGRSAKPLARLPVTEMKPWIRDLSDMWQALFGKMPPLKVSFRARALPDTWADFRMDRHSWANSGLAHVLLVMLAVLPAFIHGSEPPQDDTVIYDFTLLSINLPPIPPGEGKIGGGGGGGDRSPTPAPKGGAPKFDINQFTPPQVVLKNLQPILPADPTLLGDPKIELAEMKLDNLGDPFGPDWVDPTQGSGFGGGIGTGEGTGIGPGFGGGFGEGSGGGLGGGIYSVGGGVSFPELIYGPDPPYSEAARKAKFKGTVVLVITVQPDGTVSNPRVMKPLGLGLDENAVRTVLTWKFRPAMKGNTAVPVLISVEVNFNLF